MTVAARALAALVLLLLAAAAGYWAGDHQRDNAWRAKEAREVFDAHQKYEAEVQRGNAAAGHFLDEFADQEDRYAELQSEFEKLGKRVALLVPPVAGAASAPAAGSEPGVYAAGAAAPPCINFLVRPQLSLAAVWMWNSALAGADVPAGACGADAATEEACAAGAGLSIADAWDNHGVNARSCAADRLRYDRLIDYLQNRTPPPRDP